MRKMYKSPCVLVIIRDKLNVGYVEALQCPLSTPNVCEFRNKYLIIPLKLFNNKITSR